MTASSCCWSQRPTPQQMEPGRKTWSLKPSPSQHQNTTKMPRFLPRKEGIPWMKVSSWPASPNSGTVTPITEIVVTSTDPVLLNFQFFAMIKAEGIGRGLPGPKSISHWCSIRLLFHGQTVAWVFDLEFCLYSHQKGHYINHGCLSFNISSRLTEGGESVVSL